jgi:hypothetical protein
MAAGPIKNRLPNKASVSYTVSHPVPYLVIKHFGRYALCDIGILIVPQR